jgi:hypothetical protein
MRKLIPAVAFLLAAGSVVAQEPARPPQAPPSAPAADEMKGKKEMTAVVVATDSTVKTITVRDDKAAPGSQPETLTVSGAAVASLANVKTGEKVKLVLTKDPATNKESVTSIEKSSTPPSQ